MSNKLVDLRDTRFVLYEQLKLEELCGVGSFEDHSTETLEMILGAAEKLAVNEIAPSNAGGDKAGCRFEDGRVKVPEEFHQPFAALCQGGWLGMAESYEVGGQCAPRSLAAACNELFFAANHSLLGYLGLTHSAAKVIEIFGTPEQKEKYLMPLFSGQFGGTMDLTEPQAGSDVGALKTFAVPNQDGTYSLTGNKIFISAGEHDLTENIIHLVLARVKGAPQGTRGLSCFIVPKILPGENGQPGPANDLNCSGIEQKMGMKGSATCVLNYGDNGLCQGELIGPEGKGIVVMFHMMNEQRVLVGLQGLAQASTAYLHALDFARERRQGSGFGGGHEQVPIVEHPDVKRNLAWMKAHTEGMRSLVLLIMDAMDRQALAPKEEQQKWRSLVEVLTPVCKAFCSDRGFEVCTKAIQVHGGYGYCKEYGVEQFARDCKITSIYEGTNGIQALDLFGRKIRMDNGAALLEVLERMRRTVAEAGGIKALSDYAGEVGRAVDDLQALSADLVARSEGEKAFQAYSWASTYLEIFGEVVVAWLLLWQAATAAEGLASAGSPADRQFYQQKIATAKYFIGSVLPITLGRMEAIKKNESADWIQ